MERIGGMGGVIGTVFVVVVLVMGDDGVVEAL